MSKEPANSLSGKVTFYVIFSAFIASCSGLIFGYNIGISGGVTAMQNFLQSFFPALIGESRVAAESTYCKFNDQGLQAFTSSLYLAGLVSTFGASYLTKHSGRRITLTVAGFLSLFGVALAAAAKHIVMLIVGRILIGIGVGFANQAGPIYLSEIAPPNLRGVLNVMFQTNVGVGIFAANIVNFAVGYLDEKVGWRVALACGAVPSLMLALGGLMLVESPISLIERGRPDEGRAILQKVRGTKNVDEEFNEMVRACMASDAVQESAFRAILKPNSRPQLVISFLSAIFQQMTGINAIMFYAPALFRTVGFQSNASLYSAAIIGGVNVASTIASMFAVDRMGRRFLLIQGSLQMLIAQVVIATILGVTLKEVSAGAAAPPLPQASAITVVVLICIFVAGFGWSWGPITWLLCSELFPLETRSAGQSIAVSANLVATFIIAQAFLSMLCSMKYGIFLFFAAWLIIMTLFVAFFLPETKNIPLDSIEKVWRKHWFWKTVVVDGVVSNGNGVPVSTEEKLSQVNQTVEVATL
ncbi:hypothetical protein L7F22_060221 [Adiantum nelumboides]|nr:hypothetical protein [Adiantum nelumboides]